MAVKGVNNGCVFYEKSQSGKKTSGGGFGKEFMTAAEQSGKEAKDSVEGKETVAENAPMSTEEIMKMIGNRKNEILEKVKKGETEPVIQIGAQAYTEKQWKRMLESFGDSEKDFKDKIREALEELRERRTKGEIS